MGEPALDVFQGHDWLTYRGPVAQMFDTLDRMRELCLQVSTPVSSLALSAMSSAPAAYDVFVEDAQDVFLGIVELCDDLAGEIDAVQADLFSHFLKDVQHRWMGFEMRLHLRAMRQAALAEHQAPHPNSGTLDMILALTARLRNLLRAIDQ